MSWSWISFEQALFQTERQRRHLLLGNGFSIEACPIFRYPSLMAEAGRLDRSVRDLFQRLGDPRDFEEAISRAETPADAAAVLKSFADTIARVHPRRNPALTPEAMASCARFLARFPRGRRAKLGGQIFTTNYDFILNWIAREHRSSLYLQDGFDSNGIWRPGDGRVGMHYLHGAMHLFRSGTRLTKLMSDQKRQISLVEVARKTVLEGAMPTIVSGGSASDKVAKIKGDPYLEGAFKVFWQICRDRDDAMFIYGHSLSPVDSHITSLIGKGRVRRVFVSVFNNAAEQRLSEVASEWAASRPTEYPLEVRAFRPAEAEVWTGNTRSP